MPPYFYENLVTFYMQVKKNVKCVLGYFDTIYFAYGFRNGKPVWRGLGRIQLAVDSYPVSVLKRELHKKHNLFLNVEINV